MNKTPAVRFKGFTEDWEQRKLEDISDVRDGTHDSPVYQDEGHPFVTSKNVKNGYINFDGIQYISDYDFFEINKRSKVDINDILMGMIGTIGNLALIRTEPNFAIKNVALIKDTKNVSYLYLYHYLKSSSIERQLLFGMDGGTQKFVSLKKIRELKIQIPDDDEQIKLGTFMESLDNLIVFYQRKYEKLVNIKKSMLYKMFPQNGSKVPEIRFAGFTDEWEQRKLGKLAIFNPKAELPEIFEYVDLESVVGTEMISHRTESKITAPSRAQRLARTGDLFYQTVRPYQKNNYLFEKPDKHYVFSTGYAQMRPLVDGQFLLSLVQNENFVKMVLDNCTGTSYPAINSNDLADIEVLSPTEKEEQVNTFSNVLRIFGVVADNGDILAVQPAIDCKWAFTVDLGNDLSHFRLG